MGRGPVQRPVQLVIMSQKCVRVCVCRVCNCHVSWASCVHVGVSGMPLYRNVSVYCVSVCLYVCVCVVSLDIERERECNLFAVFLCGGVGALFEWQINRDGGRSRGFIKRINSPALIS